MNERVKKEIMQAVENQLQMNEPKCTKETFERLVASGSGENQAKEMIAAVLLEEMYHILKNKEPFNEQRYTEKLSSLGSVSLLELENNYENLDMQEIIQSIEYNYGTFPEEALREIIRRKDEAVPFLLNILKKVREEPQEYAENQDYFGHIYAAYLLAQFRIVEAYPLLIEILKLPKEISYELYGDTFCEDGSRIFASLCDGKIGALKELIRNKDVEEHIRGAAVTALAILALQGVIARVDVIEYYRTLLTGGLDDNNSHVIAEAISSANKLYPEELMNEIMAAHRNKLVDEMYIDLEFIQETLELGKDWVLDQYKFDPYHQYINDTIEELHWWECFQKDSLLGENDMGYANTYTQTVTKDFKVGRNDPCPCGSGKKYKKCCGK